MSTAHTQQVPSIDQLTQAQHSTLDNCLLDHLLCSSRLEGATCLHLLLDDLLIPTSGGTEMSSLTIDCDVDPDNIAPHLLGVPGITFEFMDEQVTLPTVQAIRYLCHWCETQVEEDRQNILAKCQALKDHYQA